MTRRAPLPRRVVDWAAIRQKLALSRETPRVAAEERAQILAQRAERLAQRVDAREIALSLEVLSFERAGRRYAIESRFVLEVGKCGRLSRVPGAQPAFLGVTNLRGDVLPVFDLALLAEATAPHPLSPQLVVLGADRPDFGVLTDSVDQVSRLPLGEVSAVSAVGVLPYAEYLRGITAEARLLLDGDALLRDRSVFVAKPASGSAFERD